MRNNNKLKQQTTSGKEQKVSLSIPNSQFSTLASGWQIPGWLVDFKTQALIIAMLAIGLYCNTFRNEYALDDTAIIVGNEFVHQGFAGIPDILTKDAYYSYYSQLRSSDQLSGGRYRPLSIVTFAIEQQAFGAVPKDGVDSVTRYGLGYDKQQHYEQQFLKEMHVRHVVNVLLFALMAVILLYFFSYVVFKDNPLMALIAAIIFTVHPIHTEVVANVKSRDEIMSLLFICLNFIFAFKYLDYKKPWQLMVALFSYFLAFLSKEYAITLLGLLPLAFYLFHKYTVRKSIIATLPYIAVAVVYIIIRWQVIGPRNELSDNDIQINPYAWASATEKLATEIATSLNYLKLLLFPHPLSADYSYNQIPYKDFTHPLVWLSFAVHLSLVAFFFYFLKKRHVLCFAIAFYLFNLLMVCNIIFDIGATMGERLIFHASVGFAIAAAYLLVKGVEKIRPARVRWMSLAGSMLLIIVLCGFKTIERNKDWKNDETLFFHDIKVVPNSFLVDVDVAAILVNKSDFETDEQKRIDDLHRATSLFGRAIAMQNDYVLGYMNRSVAWYKLGEADSMKAGLDRVMKLYPIHPQLPEMYYHLGMLYYNNRQYPQADSALLQSLKLNPRNNEVKKTIEEVEKAMQETK